MNIINKNNCSLVIEGIGRRAYVNNLRGRKELARDLAGTNDKLLEEVLSIWGDTPTVEDEAESEKTFDELKTEKRAEIAAARYAKETSGFGFEGVKIATDRGSQALLTAAVVTARFDPEFRTKWKCDDGQFVTLDALQLRAIGDAVTVFIEGCFSREAELCELVNAAQNKHDLDSIEISF